MLQLCKCVLGISSLTNCSGIIFPLLVFLWPTFYRQQYSDVSSDAVKAIFIPSQMVKVPAARLLCSFAVRDGCFLSSHLYRSSEVTSKSSEVYSDRRSTEVHHRLRPDTSAVVLSRGLAPSPTITSFYYNTGKAT